MKITDIKIVSFRTHADRWDMGHAKPLPRTELMQTVSSIETDAGRHRLLLRRRLARRPGGPERLRPGAPARPHPQAPRRPGSVRPRDDLEVDVGRQHLGERRQRRRPDAVGPRRTRPRAARLQAPRRGPRPRQGVCQHLPQYRLAASLCRARARLQKRRLPRLQDPPALFLEPGDAAADAGAAIECRRRHPHLPSRPRSGRAGHGADVRPLGHVPHHGGGAAGRARAREARLLLVRAPDARIPRRELRAALPRADDPDPVAGDRRRRGLHAGRNGSSAAPPT